MGSEMCIRDRHGQLEPGRSRRIGCLISKEEIARIFEVILTRQLHTVNHPVSLSIADGHAFNVVHEHIVQKVIGIEVEIDLSISGDVLVIGPCELEHGLTTGSRVPVLDGQGSADGLRDELLVGVFEIGVVLVLEVHCESMGASDR